MERMRRLLLCIAAALLAALDSHASNITIGAFFADWAKNHDVAAKVAAMMINERSDLLGGHTLRIVSVDIQPIRVCDEGRPLKECFLDSNLDAIKQLGAEAIVGVGYSSDVAIINQILNQHQILLISHSAANPLISDKSLYPLVGRTSLSGALEGQAIANCVSFFQYQTVKVATCDDAYCQGLAVSFQEHAQKLGIRVVLEETVSTGASENDILVELENFLGSCSSSKVVVLLLHAELADFIFDAAEELGVKQDVVWIVGYDVGLRAERTPVGTLTLYSKSYGGPVWESVVRYWEGLDQEKYAGIEEIKSDPSGYASRSYDAVLGLAHAYHSLLSDGISLGNKSAVKRALQGVSVEGASGPLAFDENLDPPNGEFIIANILPDKQVPVLEYSTNWGMKKVVSSTVEDLATWASSSMQWPDGTKGVPAELPKISVCAEFQIGFEALCCNQTGVAEPEPTFDGLLDWTMSLGAFSGLIVFLIIAINYKEDFIHECKFWLSKPEDQQHRSSSCGELMDSNIVFVVMCLLFMAEAGLLYMDYTLPFDCYDRRLPMLSFSSVGIWSIFLVELVFRLASNTGRVFPLSRHPANVLHYIDTLTVVLVLALIVYHAREEINFSRSLSEAVEADSLQGTGHEEMPPYIEETDTYSQLLCSLVADEKASLNSLVHIRLLLVLRVICRTVLQLQKGATYGYTPPGQAGGDSSFFFVIVAFGFLCLFGMCGGAAIGAITGSIAVAIGEAFENAGLSSNKTVLRTYAWVINIFLLIVLKVCLHIVVVNSYRFLWPAGAYFCTWLEVAKPRKQFEMGKKLHSLDWVEWSYVPVEDDGSLEETQETGPEDQNSGLRARRDVDLAIGTGEKAASPLDKAKYERTIFGDSGILNIIPSSIHRQYKIEDILHFRRTTNKSRKEVEIALLVTNWTRHLRNQHQIVLRLYCTNKRQGFLDDDVEDYFSQSQFERRRQISERLQQPPVDPDQVESTTGHRRSVEWTAQYDESEIVLRQGVRIPRDQGSLLRLRNPHYTDSAMEPSRAWTWKGLVNSIFLRDDSVYFEEIELREDSKNETAKIGEAPQREVLDTALKRRETNSFKYSDVLSILYNLAETIKGFHRRQMVYCNLDADVIEIGADSHSVPVITDFSFTQYVERPNLVHQATAKFAGQNASDFSIDANRERAGSRTSFTGLLSISNKKQGKSQKVDLVGRAASMAPELLRKRAATSAADVYSLGVIAHRMLNFGSFPWSDENNDNIAHLSAEEIVRITTIQEIKQKKDKEYDGELVVCLNEVDDTDLLAVSMHAKDSGHELHISVKELVGRTNIEEVDLILLADGGEEHAVDHDNVALKLVGMFQIKLTPEAQNRAGIPPEAKTFGFCEPLKLGAPEQFERRTSSSAAHEESQEESKLKDIVSSLRKSEDPLVQILLHGGLLYADEQTSIKSLKAVNFGPVDEDSDVLYLANPQTKAESDSSMFPLHLEEKSAFVANCTNFGWIRPNTTEDSVSNEQNGGFIFKERDSNVFQFYPLLQDYVSASEGTLPSIVNKMLTIAPRDRISMDEVCARLQTLRSLSDTDAKNDFYVSYFSEGDASNAEMVYKQLNERGLQGFHDRHCGFSGKHELETRIRTLKQSLTFIPILSEAVFNSLKDKVTDYKYDIFLSYRRRANADGEIIAQLHETLSQLEIHDGITRRKLKVFYDQKELQPGKRWEQEFCEALMGSRVFVPVLSTECVEQTKKLQEQNAEDPQNCDNFILEQNLAMFLHGMGRIKTLMPIVMPTSKIATLSSLCPDVGYVGISHKAKTYLGTDPQFKAIPHLQRQPHESLSEPERLLIESHTEQMEILERRTVRNTIASILEFQAVRLSDGSEESQGDTTMEQLIQKIGKAVNMAVSESNGRWDKRHEKNHPMLMECILALHLRAQGGGHDFPRIIPVVCLENEYSDLDHLCMETSDSIPHRTCNKVRLFLSEEDTFLGEGANEFQEVSIRKTMEKVKEHSVLDKHQLAASQLLPENLGKKDLRTKQVFDSLVVEVRAAKKDFMENNLQTIGTSGLNPQTLDSAVEGIGLSSTSSHAGVFTNMFRSVKSAIHPAPMDHRKIAQVPVDDHLFASTNGH